MNLNSEEDKNVFNPYRIDSSDHSHRVRLFLAKCSYCILLLACAVGFRSFQIDGIQQYAMESQGSVVEAGTFLVSTSMLVALALTDRHRRVLLTRIGFFAPMFALCGISLLWSSSPIAGGIRFLQFLLVSLSVMSAISMLGWQSLWQLTGYVLASVMALNLLSVALVTGAIHQQNTYGEVLAGAWKGLHIHKNHAGALAAITAIILTTRSFKASLNIRLLFLTVTVVFLAGTQSKTSILLLTIVLACTPLFTLALKRLDKSATSLLVVISITAGAALYVMNRQVIADFLNDGNNLTGRVELWQALAVYLSENYMGGSGFGSFWRVGSASPILTITDGWGSRTGQAHNGYIDVIISVGFPIGIVFFFYYILYPTVTIILKSARINPSNSAILYIMFFCILHNLSETSFMVGNSAVFFVFSLAVYSWIEELRAAVPAKGGAV